MVGFVGRRRELEGLCQLQRKRCASLVVIRGRLRIGKSRLIDVFSGFFKASYIFSGIQGGTAQTQKKEFVRQMRQLRVPQFGGNDWGDLFYDVAQHCQKGQVLVVLDEITWMGNKDPTFLGKLKTAWDLCFKKNPNVILVLSGSNSYWIEKNILSSTGFMGRVSYRLLLEELPLRECNEFWGESRDRIAPYEKFKLLSVTGGVPRYLEEIQPHMSAEKNIRELCYQKEGLLFNEFEEIFSDLFSRRQDSYRRIVCQLANGSLTMTEIAKKLGRERGGDLAEALEDLCEAGFIRREHSWRLRSGKSLQTSRFRLSDNYTRFYLKYVQPYRAQILEGTMRDLPAGWQSIMGIQFENLVIGNCLLLLDLLAIPHGEVINFGPFVQTNPRCQIDLLIQTKFNTLYVCEVKFAKQAVGPKVISELRKRIESLRLPRGFSVRPVLIHINGVQDSVLERDFFADIVDFGDLLRLPRS